jgi:hypothetical protein
MAPKQFAVLATAAAISLIAAVAIYSARVPWTAPSGATAPLVADFGDVAPKIARIEITAGGTTLALAKPGETWEIASQGGYPASTEKIRALMLSLAEARLLEPKTRNPDRWGLLDVEDPAANNSKARLIKLEDKDGAVLAEVIAGKQRPAQMGAAPGAPGAGTSAGTYVRRPGDPQSWLASASIAGSANLRDWVEPRVFETDTQRVTRLNVEVAGNPAYEIKRNDDKSHTLADIPAGKKVKFVNDIDNILEAASFMEFDSIRKPTGAQGGDAGTVSFETDNGLKVTIKVRRENDKAWATVEATGEGGAKDAADAIAKRAKGWEFEISPNKVSTMLKKRDDLLEDAAS